MIVTLLKYFDRERFRLTLAVANLQNAAYRAEVPADVELIDLRCRRVRWAVFRLLWLARKRRPEVLFTTLGHLNLAVAILKPFLPRHTLCVARESSVVSKIMYQHASPGLMRLLYRLFYKNLDFVVCQSQMMREDLVAGFGFPKQRTAVIANPVDTAKIRVALQDAAKPPEFRADRFNLVAAGRLSHEKGMDLLLQAGSICADLPLSLVVIGDGPLRRSLEEQAAKLGTGDRVTFAGFRPNPFVYLAAADAFVLSSRVEGFPNVVLEALACGTPVIATPCADMLADLLDGHGNGWLASAISAPALAECIRKAFRAAPMSPDQAYLDTAFGVSRLVPQYQDLIIRLAGRPEPGRLIV